MIKRLPLFLGGCILLGLLAGTAWMRPQSTAGDFALLYEYSAVQTFDVDLNQRWRIDADGQLFHVDEDGSQGLPHHPAFYTENEMPTTPELTLSSAAMDAISQAIDDNDFFELPSYHADQDAEDGALVRLTISKDGRIHAVTLLNQDEDAIHLLIDAINDELPEDLALLHVDWE